MKSHKTRYTLLLFLEIVLNGVPGEEPLARGGFKKEFKTAPIPYSSSVHT